MGLSTRRRIGGRGESGLDRRTFLRSGVTASAAGLLAGLDGCEDAGSEPNPFSSEAGDRWDSVRDEFIIDRGYIHLAGMLLAPHPRTVRHAVARHREEFDRNPADYVLLRGGEFQQRSREAAAEYIAGRPDDIALTDSTTMGIGLVYNGLRVAEGQEMLTSEDDYRETHNALRYKAERTGARIRKIRLCKDVRQASADEIVETLTAAITPRTRVLAATWVHSKSGLKIPVRRIADRLAEINGDRPPEQRVLFCVDGVHGFGVEDANVAELGCDFFFAGTHKWIFAPRGTGIIWGRPDAQEQLTPTIPTFTRDDTWGGAMTPGGYKAYEHQWAMPEAFAFHRQIGRRDVQHRIHTLTQHLKEGLQQMEGVTVRTPADPSLNAGILCFEVAGMRPREVVQRLASRHIIASVTPYDPPYARFSPGLLNTEQELDRTLAAVRALA